MTSVLASENSDDEKMKKFKLAFQDAHTSYLNVNFLSNMQEGFEKSLCIRCFLLQKYPGEKKPEKLLNQAHFLGHAYMCLVWLPELVGRNFKEDLAKKNKDIIAFIGSRVNFDETLKKISGYRVNLSPGDECKIKDFGDILRLIRNGLSHARVEINPSNFKISDIDDRKKEPVETTLTLSWEDLGKIADAYLLAVSDVLYPMESKP
jgi:hypothetical protein